MPRKDWRASKASPILFSLVILLNVLHSSWSFTAAPNNDYLGQRGGYNDGDKGIPAPLVEETEEASPLQGQLQSIGLEAKQIAKILFAHQERSTVKKGQTNRTTCMLLGHNSNIDWLKNRFTKDQTAALLVGLPSILTYDLKSKLEPTINFYQNALETGMKEETTNEKQEHVSILLEPRLSAFVSDSPGLLEYNVNKRLIPRYQQAQEVLGAVPFDEESITAIATKTDSRFQEWLQHQERGGTINAERPHPHISSSSTQQQLIQNQPRSPASYMVLSNLQSGGNIGNILRSASTFGCEECLVVGQKRHRLTGDHGSRFDLPRKHLWSHTDARDYLHAKEIRIYGVEIMVDASPIMQYNSLTGVVEFPFDRQYRGAAFVMGNEGNGLSDKQKEICDEFIYVPQTRGGSRSRSSNKSSPGGGARGGSASLNVACAATVILQAYCLWACYPVAGMEGEKFVAL